MDVNRTLSALKELLESQITEVRIVRSKRTPSSVKRKRRRYYRKRKARLKRLAKRRRRSPRSKRLAKRRNAIRKRMHIKPGSRRRIRLVTSKEGSFMKDGIAKLLEDVQALEQETSGAPKEDEKQLATAFEKTANLATDLSVKIEAAQSDDEDEEAKKKAELEAEAKKKTDDEDMFAMDIDDLPDDDSSDWDKCGSIDDLPGEEDDEDPDGDESEEDPEDHPEHRGESAEQLISDLKTLAEDARAMKADMLKGGSDLSEAREILKQMVEYIDTVTKRVIVEADTHRDATHADLAKGGHDGDKKDLTKTTTDPKANSTGKPEHDADHVGTKHSDADEGEKADDNDEHHQKDVKSADLKKGTPIQVDKDMHDLVTDTGKSGNVTESEDDEPAPEQEPDESEKDDAVEEPEKPKKKSKKELEAEATQRRHAAAKSVHGRVKEWIKNEAATTDKGKLKERLKIARKLEDRLFKLNSEMVAIEKEFKDSFKDPHYNELAHKAMLAVDNLNAQFGGEVLGLDWELNGGGKPAPWDQE